MDISYQILLTDKKKNISFSSQEEGCPSGERKLFFENTEFVVTILHLQLVYNIWNLGYADHTENVYGLTECKV